MEENPATADPVNKPRRRWFSFSLRTLLLVSVVLSVCFAWLGEKRVKVQHQRQAIAHLQARGYDVLLEYEHPNTMAFWGYTEPPGPRWLRKWLGDDFFADVTQITALVPMFKEQGPTPRFTDDEAQIVSSFPGLQVLDIGGVLDVTDIRLKRLENLAEIESLSLEECPITDTGMIYLERHRHLCTLRLGDTKITDLGLVHLEGLAELEDLDLHGTMISDAGLDHLKGLAQLKVLHLERTQVTDVGAAKLQKALPNCNIDR